jgi:hypothetical protein
MSTNKFIEFCQSLFKVANNPPDNINTTSIPEEEVEEVEEVEEEEEEELGNKQQKLEQPKKAYMFEHELFGSNDNHCKFLYLRDCYSKLFDLILQYKTSNPLLFGNTAIILGSAGVGLSCFSLYCVIRYIQLGKLVLFTHPNQSTVAFISSEQVRKSMQQAFPSRNFQVNQVYPVFLEDFEKLNRIEQDNKVEIFDAAHDQVIPGLTMSFRIVTCTPSVGGLSELVKSAMASIWTKYYMPTWSEEEAMDIAPSCGMRNSDMNHRHFICGGVIKLMLNDQHEEILTQQCQQVTIDTIQKYSKTWYFERLPRDIVIINLVNPNDFTKITSDIISKFAVGLIVENSAQALGMEETMKKVWEFLKH